MKKMDFYQILSTNQELLHIFKLNNLKFLFKMSNISSFSESSLFVLTVAICPAVLKSLSDGTDAGGIERYFLAILARIGQTSCFSFL